MHRCFCGKEEAGKCCAGPCLRVVQIVLLVLIVIGLGLIATQQLWVPQLVDRIMRTDGSEASVLVMRKPASNAAIRVTSPAPQSVVTSPLSVSGTALGTWYFEGSFPISVKDENGQIFGQGTAQAQGEWMTTEPVPFQATIDFTSSVTATGFLVFSKDNPSGLPENAAEVALPIRFR